MASYPTTNKTFASRSNGSIIDASHVNDLQDEVAAIEDGILNGTARLNSSGSTVATLSVAGGSTLAGTLQVTGGSTFTGAVKFNGGITSTVSFTSSVTFDAGVTITGTLTGSINTPPTVRVRSSANTSLSTSGEKWVGLSWDIEDYDSTGMHSTATNSSRLTFAGSTGIYHVGAAIHLGLDNQIETRVRLVLNDSTTFLANSLVLGASTVAMHCLAADYRIQSTADYVTVQAMTAAASTAVVVANSTVGVTALWAHRVSI